ncbi:receptor-like protein EIX1 [Dioscorea cayenensis subsp. rotundata]|uniref:Receptor-like protein EIX1 n=1 Tax=Dioscorea cayennensis subsp. rotundata TaxID=55577 RepID=A0AB40C3M6_DIOCR|nr:receptor-like protein EIX1 [Dioscorea cayenensis subsp. rotundata]
MAGGREAGAERGEVGRRAAQFKELRYLNLSDCYFAGAIPASFGNLSSLHTLDLSRNYYIHVDDSALQWLSHLTSLQHLDMSRVNLSSMSRNLFLALNKLPSINELHLSFCELEKLPLSILHLNFSSLSILDLSYNYINFSEISWVFKVKSLQSLDLSHNDLYFPTNPIISLKALSAYHPMAQPNDISIPESIGSLCSLQILDLSGLNIRKRLVELEGSLPSSLTSLSFLEELLLDYNQLTGTLPKEIGNLTELSYLGLSGNQLSGPIPRIVLNNTFSSYSDISISMNKLNGSVPDCHNNFNGKIPAWIGEHLSYLMVLMLKWNAFVNHIPQEISQLEYLQILDLSSNNLSGPIPNSLGNLTTMQMLPGTTDKVPILLASRNIPEELASLYGLQSLNFSGNTLEGEIPQKLGRMQQLESLDLSRNKLSGSIPETLSNLTFLNHFNVSYNNLTGRIPFAHQFSTFNDSFIYIGNHLCGAPLGNNCTKDGGIIKKESLDRKDEDDDGMLWVYIGSLSGFAVGFWTVWGVLAFKKNWRQACLFPLHGQYV